MNSFLVLSLFLIISLPTVYCDNGRPADEENNAANKTTALHWKIGAIGSILLFSALGVFLPLFLKKIRSFQPGKPLFFMLKSFAAGVILATGFVHVLQDAFELLTSPFLKENPWRKFPFNGFIAMMGAIGTLVVENVATTYYNKHHFNEALPVTADEENVVEHADHVHVHTHATHGHAHGSNDQSSGAVLSRHRIIAQVLEWGIVVHSFIIGISLGASGEVSTVKTLLVALSFHQLFEGMGLGGCISQANFKTRAIVVMALCFTVTTPVGIAIGIGISKFYKENSPRALIVEGVLTSFSAGILIYMALALVAADFRSPRVQGSFKLLLELCGCLLLGAVLMSLIAIWA